LEHLQHDWNRQREQLSALLDNELAEHERATLEAHLHTCANCRAELASLRRARALVRALPQPALPRSFALPVEATPLAAGAARKPTSVPPTSITSRRRPVRALQWFSAIAAVLGIVLLLSSAFSSVSFRGGAANTASFGSSSRPVAGAVQPTSTQVPEPTRSSPNTEPGVGTPAPTAEETPTATPVTNVGSGHSSDNPPGSSSGLSLASFLSVTGLGFLLLVLSACGFALAWSLRRW
jgi:negative regulator of sigma E activity